MAQRLLVGRRSYSSPPPSSTDAKRGHDVARALFAFELDETGNTGQKGCRRCAPRIAGCKQAWHIYHSVFIK